MLWSSRAFRLHSKALLQEFKLPDGWDVSKTNVFVRLFNYALEKGTQTCLEDNASEARKVAYARRAFDTTVIGSSMKPGPVPPTCFFCKLKSAGTITVSEKFFLEDCPNCVASKQLNADHISVFVKHAVRLQFSERKKNGAGALNKKPSLWGDVENAQSILKDEHGHRFVVYERPSDPARQGSAA